MKAKTLCFLILNDYSRPGCGPVGKISLILASNSAYNLDNCVFKAPFRDRREGPSHIAYGPPNRKPLGTEEIRFQQLP